MATFIAFVILTIGIIICISSISFALIMLITLCFCKNQIENHSPGTDTTENVGKFCDPEMYNLLENQAENHSPETTKNSGKFCAPEI